MMCKIIQFPKNRRTEEFYKFLVRWSDGVTFKGATLEECFIKQKDVFEPEFSMAEYLERFRYRLECVTGIYYSFKDVNELVDCLVENGFLEVITTDDERTGTESK